ncbi:MAG: glucose-6-phosphate dehydrogenase assembly protein OpcA, partial [Acidimicrobiales bacterium]
MTTTLWDTSGGEVVKALVAERRAGAAVSSGLAVTLVAIVDERNVAVAEQAATIAAQQHPCRLVIVIRRQLDTTDRLDAEVQVGGRLGPTEAVVMRMYGRLALHAESLVLPLLAADAPVVTWWHGAPPDEIATDPLGVLADRRITDSAMAPDPIASLATRAGDFSPGDTDLAWTRTTPWRSLLASAFDATEQPATAVRVAAAKGNPSAPLLASWLGGRLGVTPELSDSTGPGITSVEVDVADDPGDTCRICLTRLDGRLATFSRTGQPERQLPLMR